VPLPRCHCLRPLGTQCCCRVYSSIVTVVLLRSTQWCIPAHCTGTWHVLFVCIRTLSIASDFPPPCAAGFLLVGNATRVVADMSTCNLLPRIAGDSRWALCVAHQGVCGPSLWMQPCAGVGPASWPALWGLEQAGAVARSKVSGRDH